MMRYILASALGVFLVPGAAVLGQREKPVFQAKNIKVEKHRVSGDIVNQMLIHYRVSFGTNFLKPENRHQWGDPEKDFSRLATTYFARKGPAGIALEKLNWFKDRHNTYHSDSRLPAALAGQGASALSCPLPAGLLAAMWSEPAIGVIGLEVGTFASYGRPFQCLDFFERDQTIIDLASGKEPLFHYFPDARQRGAHIQIFAGEPRPTLAKNAGKGFYHVLILEPYKEGIELLHKDLLTKEGMALCMDKLAPEGVLCIHVSSRYYKLVPVVADVANSLGLACLHGHDSAPWGRRNRLGHYSSEWVMVARKISDLGHLETPEGYDEAVKQAKANGEFVFNEGKFWQVPDGDGKRVWTDKAENSYRGLYRSDPGVGRLRNVVYDLQNWFIDRGLGYQTIQPIMQPILSAIDALDRLVVKEKNWPG